MRQMKRVRRLCAVLALVFALLAAVRLAFGAVPAVDPALLTARIQCSWLECRVRTDVAELLPASHREAARRPGAEEQLRHLLRSGCVQALLFGGEMLRALPGALFFAALAFAFRRFAGRTGSDVRALAWLRRAALAGLAAVLAQPVADTVRATALAPIALGRDQLFLSFNGGPFFWGLVVAGAAWAAVSVLEQGERARAELAEIV